MIKVEELTKCYGDFTAVDSISFHVAKGEIVGFLGLNGAGKTTLFDALAGSARSSTPFAVSVYASFSVIRRPVPVSEPS